MTDIAKRVRDILAPAPRRSKRRGFEGALISSDAFYNLEGVIQDIKHGGIKPGDKVCIGTLERVQKQVIDVLDICAEKKDDRQTKG